ncbi:hypothetical protein NKW53_05380 [Acetobacter orientalis]|uniref:hypothetical protein n=1 Tax=Acetobacter orientalis TaxID=146474 RepID=UPI00209DC495|nr:hypothetical protein [Acetobacter orientalis]MCP1215496.1 hypothetical protein [Acetobacter orientalis]MCP1217651.1 hypothetical protein [Acetobacter orientalis]
MSDPELTSETQPPKRRRFKCCVGKAAFALGVCLLAGTGLALHKSRADGLMARIHHGLVVCAPGTGLSMTPNSAGLLHTAATPAMLRLQLATQNDGRVIVVPGSNQLSEVLASSRRARTLLMLDLNDTDPVAVAKLIRKARMRDRVVLVAPDHEGIEAALQADSAMMVAIPIRSTRDAYLAHRMAGHHPYAAYVAPNATPALFALVHRDAEAIITENPNTPALSTTKFLAERPVDIVVTQQPTQLTQTLKHDS